MFSFLGSFPSVHSILCLLNVDYSIHEQHYRMLKPEDQKHKRYNIAVPDLGRFNHVLV